MMRAEVARVAVTRATIFSARRFFAMNGAGTKDETDTAPRTFNGDITALPPALKPLSEIDHWVAWLWTRGNGSKWTKPPLQPRSPNRRAKNNDPATWCSHAEAANAVRQGLGHGIGFVLTDTKIAAIDLDHCRDPEPARSIHGRRPSLIGLPIRISKSR